MPPPPLRLLAAREQPPASTFDLQQNPIQYMISRFKNPIAHHQKEARVSECVVGERVLFFDPSSIGSCCFLLLVACLLGVSLVSRVSSVSELHIFISLV